MKVVVLYFIVLSLYDCTQFVEACGGKGGSKGGSKKPDPPKEVSTIQKVQNGWHLWTQRPHRTHVLYNLPPLTNDTKFEWNAQCGEDRYLQPIDKLEECIDDFLGTIYLGHHHIAADGKNCAAWKAHRKRRAAVQENPGSMQVVDLGLTENFCRQTGDKNYLWCYTSDDHSTQEKCNVPLCSTVHAGVADDIVKKKLANSNILMRKKRQARIVGGENAVNHAWDSFFQLITMRDGRPHPSSNMTYYPCGSTLIDPRWLITAAHCVKTSGNMHSIVEINHYDYHFTDRDFLNKHVWVHPDYAGTAYELKDSNIKYDVALIKLPRAVTKATPFCLPYGHEHKIGPNKEDTPKHWGNCYMAGLGNINIGMDEYQIPYVLQQLKFRNNMVHDPGHAVVIKVASALKQGSGRIGDSGGPLVCFNRHRIAWELIGMVAGGGDYDDGGALMNYTPLQHPETSSFVQRILSENSG